LTVKLIKGSRNDGDELEIPLRTELER
jgi:hypothetical protein